METLDRKTIIELATFTGKPCVSIYIPTHKKGHEVNEGQDLILFKNQMQHLKTELHSRNLKTQDIETMLEPGFLLLKNKEFWKNMDHGLAVFLAPGMFLYLKCPFRFEELLIINNHFHVKPLLPIAEGQKVYYILKLTKIHPKLYKANKYSIEEVETEGIFPDTILEISKYYDSEDASINKGMADPRHINTGGNNNDNKEKDHILTEYFRKINESVKSLIGTEKAPLLLAGVEYFHPLYRKVNTHPYLFEGGLKGNFDHTALHELHGQANELMENYFVDELKKRLETFHNLSDTNRVSVDLQTILKAAATGRVDTLFLSSLDPVWGKFDENTLEVSIHQDYQQDDEGLLNKASVLTLINGGNVFVGTREKELELGLPVAALFRY
jgi:hypothetical protein